MTSHAANSTAPEHHPTRVRHDAVAHRFEAAVATGTAIVEYRCADGVITFTHTAVPPKARGHGVADALAHAALEFARAKGLRVVPACPFFAAFIARHAQYTSLLGGQSTAP